MKRTLTLAVSVLCATTTLFAQQTTVPTEEAAVKGKEINDIKRSEEAIYADVLEFVAPESEEIPTLAQQKSQQMLQAHVIEVFAKRMKMDKKDVQEIWDVIDDKCQNIVVRKGDLCRVFTYIMKDALGLAPKKPKKGDVEKYLEDDKEEIVAEAPKDTAQVLLAEAPVQQPPWEQAVAPVEVPEPVATPVVVKEPEPAPQPLPEPEPVPVVVEVPQLAKEMLAKSDMTELLRFLVKEKSRQTLMYGSLASMTNAEKCYVIIINKPAKKVVTVLGPGTEQRINYVTFKQDAIANYKGGDHQAIVVQEY